MAIQFHSLMLLPIEIAFIAAALILLIPCTFLLLQCLAAFWPDSPLIETDTSSLPKVSVLIPAHNEASVLEMTLETLLPQVTKPKDIVVIADNCTDDTAAVAQKLGVMVLERQDEERWGKGYALDYGLQFLETDPPEIVVFVDADCNVTDNAIGKIAHLAFEANRPVQAVYLMEQPINPSSQTLISALAIKVKNFVRLYGLSRLGLPSLLTGSGMAFPWQAIRQVSLAHGKSTDDMQLSVDLAIAGYPPLFCHRAVLIGRLQEKKASATKQRERWEHAHLETLLTQAPRLLKAAIAKRRYELIALALDLYIPPLSLLIMLWLLAASSALVATFFGASIVPLWLLAIAGLFIFVAIALAWAKFGRDDIPGKSLIAIPFYLAWKIPIYIAFSLKPQTKWLRSDRDDS
jgi:cellulose synthase/poly-beta-1,6-N-acetylglucosamine synthase-like glycosyltransferase